MFQYAFARALKHRFPKQKIRFCDKTDSFKYQLERIFGIPKEEANALEKLWCKYRLLPKFLVRPFYDYKSYCEKFSAVFERRYLELPCGSYYISGCFQSMRYFKDIFNEIARDFTLKIPLNAKNSKTLEKIRSCESVCLHVRRGDYLKPDIINLIGIVGLDYYKRAIEFISQRVSNPKFFVFSNDIAWARDNLGIEAVFVDWNDQENYFDLELMRNCKHNIIANSTFSWWGGALNENPHKIVIAPKVWFKALPYDDIVPDGWIKL